MECPMRSWIRRLERDARGHLESFELLDGSTYYYDGLETYKELFLHAYDVHIGDAHKWPEPPEVYRKMCEARDVAAVLKRFKPDRKSTRLNSSHTVISYAVFCLKKK